MQDDFYMPGLSHFENDNGWSGSRGRLCYEIERPQDGKLKVVTWYGPFCREYAQEDAVSFFEVTAEGIAAMTDWLLRQAEEMNAHPQKTPEDCRAYYEQCVRGDQPDVSTT